jgi:hypothetical protein
MLKKIKKIKSFGILKSKCPFFYIARRAFCPLLLEKSLLPAKRRIPRRLWGKGLRPEGSIGCARDWGLGL